MENPEIFELQPHELIFGLAEVIRETQKEIGYLEIKPIAKNHLDKVIEETIKRKNKILNESEIKALASRLSTLSKYYASANRMSVDELLSEKHQPRKLSRHIKYRNGSKRPPNVATHAIISGMHEEAIAARQILARWKIRIDDPDNGVFLPRDFRYIPHPKLPNAANHAELHTKKYYVNITNLLRQTTSERACRLTLRLIAKQLQEGKMEY